MQTFNFGIAQPKIEALKTRINNLLELTMARVAAHISSPGIYVLPADPACLERKLHQFYLSLNSAERAAFITKTNVFNNNTVQQNRAKYEDLLDLNLKTGGSVLEQIKSFPLPEKYKFTASESDVFSAPASKRKISGNKQPILGSNNIQPTGATPRTLTLFLEKVKCIDPQDVIKDEIFFTGNTTDTLGRLGDIPITSTGKFKKGDSKQLALKLKDFDLREPGFFPQNFLLNFLMFDKDSKKNEADIIRIKDILFEVGAWGLAIANLMLVISFITIAAGQIPVGLAIFIAGLAVEVITLFTLMTSGIFEMLQADFAENIVDFFVFDLPPLSVGEFVDVTKRAVLVGSRKGNLKGNYDITFRWERTA